MLPLLGGSGGAGSPQEWSVPPQGASGGAGGGAILIAGSGRVVVDGSIHADGGKGGLWLPGRNGAGGSGGGIRLVSSQLAGVGQIRAASREFFPECPGDFAGEAGRTRIERVSGGGTLSFLPDPSVLALADGATPQIWLPDNGPTVKIVSVGNQNAPADPRAEFAAIGADLVLPQVSTSEVVVETTNVEQASTVKVRVTPRSNGNYTLTQATLDQVVTEDPLVIRWKANVPVNNGYSALQVHVVRP